VTNIATPIGYYTATLVSVPGKPLITPMGSAIAAPRFADFPNLTGAYSVSGVATVSGAGPSNLVLVRLSDQLPVAAKQSASDGSYTFTGLVAGEYAVVVFDPSGAYRAKVVHTAVP
jgi:hypothetical protein